MSGEKWGQRTVNGRSTDARRTVGSPTCIQPATSQRTVSGRSVSRVGAMKTQSSSVTRSAWPRALGFPLASAFVALAPDSHRQNRWLDPPAAAHSGTLACDQSRPNIRPGLPPGPATWTPDAGSRQRQDRTVAHKVARSRVAGEFEQQLTNACCRTVSARPTRRVAAMTTQPPNDRPRFSADRPCAEQLLRQPVGIRPGVAPRGRKAASVVGSLEP